MTRAQKIAQLRSRDWFWRLSVGWSGCLQVNLKNDTPRDFDTLAPELVPDLIKWLQETFVDEDGS